MNIAIMNGTITKKPKKYVTEKEVEYFLFNLEVEKKQYEISSWNETINSYLINYDVNDEVEVVAKLSSNTKDDKHYISLLLSSIKKR